MGADKPGEEKLGRLSLGTLRESAKEFAIDLSARSIPNLYGVTDGKAVGTFVEGEFNAYLIERFTYATGNAASGIDFPELSVDLKVTSVRQPQSSCPYRDATQKVYGLGYHLLVLVYEKVDDAKARSARLRIQHVLFITKERTSDYQTTAGLLGILDRDGNPDDVVAFLDERNLPLDEIGRQQLAERILQERPLLGYLTMSNALQWRLQYGRAIGMIRKGEAEGLEDLLA